ncbi:response regulator [Lacinutrix cladophorae]
MNNKVNIVLVDDEILIRKGLKAILEQEDHYKIIKEFSNGEAFVHYIENTSNLPDIVLMDIKMPSLNGIETTKRLISKYPNLKIMALSNYNSEIFISNMLEVGAICYVPKSIAPSELIFSINEVFIKGFYYSENIMNHLLDDSQKRISFFDSNFLTKREKEVLNLICQQKSASEIGKQLFISPRTVDGHRNNLLLKTQSKNLVGLVLFAIQNGLFTPDFER